MITQEKAPKVVSISEVMRVVDFMIMRLSESQMGVYQGYSIDYIETWRDNGTYKLHWQPIGGSLALDNTTSPDLNFSRISTFPTFDEAKKTLLELIKNTPPPQYQKFIVVPVVRRFKYQIIEDGSFARKFNLLGKSMTLPVPSYKTLP